MYTDCGRHSNEWLFSGWSDLARWALGSAKEEGRAGGGAGGGVRRIMEDEGEGEEGAEG